MEIAWDDNERTFRLRGGVELAIVIGRRCACLVALRPRKGTPASSFCSAACTHGGARDPLSLSFSELDLLLSELAVRECDKDRKFNDWA